MKYNHVGDCRTIDRYIQKKLAALQQTNRSFADFFEFMFTEKEAPLYERSVGFKIIKTTYGEAYGRALGMAHDLRARLKNAPADATVGIHMDNGVEWIETFWAVLAAGFCPLLLNLRLDPAVLRQALDDTHAVAVIADHSVDAILAAGGFSVPTIYQHDLSDTTGTRADAPFGSRIMVMSTGTTGRVKICAYGAAEFSCLVSDSAYIVRVCAQIKRHYHGELKLLTFLPFYHVFGLIATYIWFAFFSRTFVHLNDLEPNTILQTIRRHEVTHIFAVPLFWERIYEKADRAIADKGEATRKKYRKGLAIAQKLETFPALARAFRRVAFAQVREQLFGESVQFMITGGSPIRAEALAFFNDIGYHLTNGFGMTEIGITSVELSMDARRRKAGGVGKPLPSIDYRIGENGELWVRGRSMAAAVCQNGQWTPRGAWFHTGDLAEACSGGSYRILGRTDDLIRLPNGEMLNPNLIEPSFLLPGITEACLINPAPDGETRPTLLCGVDSGAGDATLAALRAAVADRLMAGKLDIHIPDVVFIRGSLLAPDDFKLNRASVTRRYRSGALPSMAAPPAAADPDTDTLTPAHNPPPAALTEPEARVAAVFAEVLGTTTAAIGATDDFFRDLGGSSLDYFALIADLKEAFDLPFVEDGQADFHTVRGVCHYIEEKDRHAS